jgi:hypothetical protein
MAYKFYFAGCGNKSVEITIRENECNRLLSWVNERKVIEERAANGYPTFVDSGAFSAYTKHLDINVDEYIDWINRWHPYVERYAAWDTIPSDKISPKESAEKTWANYQYMKTKVADPSKLVYCFHYGEDLDYLVQALESGLDYVALGGLAKKGKKQREEFLTLVEPIFRQYPHVHVHAFGMTSVPILQRFDFIDSSDSSSWLYPPKYGRIQTNSCGEVYFGNDVDKETNRDAAFVYMLPSSQMLLERELQSKGMTIEDMFGNIGRSDWQILHWKEKMDNI